MKRRLLNLLTGLSLLLCVAGSAGVLTEVAPCERTGFVGR